MSRTNPQMSLPVVAIANRSSSVTSRWQAVVRRDPTADSFVYAVLTTKIYCRASCPARRARQANVRFYDAPSEAEMAGFRPCKRCKPQTLLALNPQAKLVQNACETIQFDIEAGTKPTLRKLAAQASLTPSHFHRVFKKLLGVTPGQYAASIKSVGAGVSTEGCNKAPSMTEPQPYHMDHLSGNMAGGDTGDTAEAVLWNDFDVLIAAEADHAMSPNLTSHSQTTPFRYQEPFISDSL
ncbi:metal binding domain of Ada-domain-containing protein [Aspergillus avenaceus]|uniref:Metal binding domain of Ada-domain-containing protein n=1 Tax=Aspergillus avenaceus TaxID=36643 RepID=A0A5N6TIJ7_ASPAV|nr:metal binding domain of Ada-domain-containing protein [Aspergillus avenaceus]